MRTMIWTVLVWTLLLAPAAPADETRQSQGDAWRAAMERIEADPVLAEQLALFETQLSVWEDAWLCHLLASPSPILRLRTLMQARYQPSELVCGFAGGPVDLAQVRADAVREGWSDPAVVMTAFILGCNVLDDRACDADRLAQRAVELEPDNAAVWLLPLQGLSRGPDQGEHRGPAREIILAAADATRFDWHYGAGIDAAFAATRAFADDHPAPTAPETLAAALPRDPLYHMEAAAFHMALTLNAVSPLPGYAAFRTECRAAQERHDRALLDACFTLADLIQAEGTTWLDRYFSAGLIYTLEHPEFVGAAREAEDPNRWKRRLAGFLQTCASPRLLLDPFSAHEMPDAHREQFIRDLASVGEVAASQRAAAREYAAYPQAYPLDPADCPKLLELDEATQKDLVELSRFGAQGGAHHQSFLEGLAEALEENP